MTNRDPPGRLELAFAAAALAGLTLLARAASWSDLVAVATVPVVLALSWRRPALTRGAGAGRAGTLVVAGAVLAAALVSLVLGVSKPDQRPLVLGAYAASVVLVAAAGVWGTTPWRRRLLAWAAVAVAAGISATLIVSLSGVATLDVWSLHRQAAGRLADGLSPWQGLAVPNGNPLAAPGATITGYPYPLPTLLAYAGAQLTAGDPRWAGWLAWTAAVGILGHAARHRRRAVVLVVLLALTPGWLIVVSNAWTEPFSLALAVGGLALWDRRPDASAVLLGLMAVSKQFLPVGLLILAVAPVAGRWRRVGLAGAVASAAWAGGFALGAGHLRATIGFHLAQPARPDSANLFGAIARAVELGWPGWLGPVAGAAAAVVLGRSVRGPAGFAWALAGALAATFLLASQAFPNYWLLVLGLVVAAAVLPGDRPAGDTPGPAADAC